MWGDADTAIGGDRDCFPSTEVSLIAAAAGDPPAMERVMALYWKPVYKFIRLKFRKDNEAAKDLTQGFFASAMEREFFQRFDPAKAGFRTYIRLAVERFAANRHESGTRLKRGGGVEFVGTRRCRRFPARVVPIRPRRSFCGSGGGRSFALALEETCAPSVFV